MMARMEHKAGDDFLSRFYVGDDEKPRTESEFEFENPAFTSPKKERRNALKVRPPEGFSLDLSSEESTGINLEETKSDDDSEDEAPPIPPLDPEIPAPRQPNAKTSADSILSILERGIAQNPLLARPISLFSRARRSAREQQDEGLSIDGSDTVESKEELPITVQGSLYSTGTMREIHVVDQDPSINAVHQETESESVEVPEHRHVTRVPPELPPRKDDAKIRMTPEPNAVVSPYAGRKLVSNNSEPALLLSSIQQPDPAVARTTKTKSAGRFMRRTESSSLMVASEPSSSPDTSSGPARFRRRRTSFLEQLLREKQARGEFDPQAYVESPHRVLAPEEEQETGMSKQEIEDKIRRIAQASAQGHNTSGVGVGLRDLGFAVARQRRSRDEADGREQQSAPRRINVRSIAKQADEAILRQQRSASSASSTASSSIAPLTAQPKQHVQAWFDPIGEVSEGAYSAWDSSNPRLDRPSMDIHQRGFGKGLRSKTDRFFGSMRLISANHDDRSASALTRLRQAIRDRILKVREGMGRIAAKASSAAVTAKDNTRNAIGTAQQKSVHARDATVRVAHEARAKAVTMTRDAKDRAADAASKAKRRTMNAAEEWRGNARERLGELRIRRSERDSQRRQYQGL